MKICTKCGIEKPLTEFYLSGRKNNLRNSCKKCDNLACKKYRTNNLQQHKKHRYTYNTSENGFLMQKISYVFAPSTIKKKGHPPDSRKDFENHFYKYVNEYGRNCFYCKEPWTYEARKPDVVVIGKKQTARLHLKNFSIDRLDSSKAYSVDNIIFCCQDCNHSKNQVSISLIKRLYEIITERNL